MVRRALPPPSRSHPPGAASVTVRLGEGAEFTAPADDHRAGDVIAAYVDDHRLAQATVRAAGAGGALTALLVLDDVPAFVFPTRVRFGNGRTGAELGDGLALADATALIVAAGRPVVIAAFAGLHPAGLAFGLRIAPLARLPHPFTLRIDGRQVAEAASAPVGDWAAQVVFRLEIALPVGAVVEVVESAFGVVAWSGVVDAAMTQAATASQLASQQAEIAELRESHAALARQLGTALEIGREKLLLARLDLFYLLLSERIDRASGAPPMPAAPGASLRIEPAAIDGIGLFEVETDGARAWRWVGPEVTLALRGIDFAPRRVVLFLHRFAGAAEPPAIRVSTGGITEPATLRSLESGFALDVPLSRQDVLLDGMLVLHVSFDRHHIDPPDERVLSAVLSGVEILPSGP